MLNAGDPFPKFELLDQDNNIVKLDDLLGSKSIIYFYPKDDTSGCTKEACGFNDALPDFGRVAAEIVGISRDPVASHDKFVRKYGLRFRLGADLDGKACEAYGTWVEKSMYGRTYMGIERATFLIDEKGIVRGVWRKVKVPGHVEEVLAAAKAL